MPLAEILPDLVFLGDLNDARRWTEARLCVLERPAYPMTHLDHHLRILYHPEDDHGVDHHDVEARPAALDAACDLIEAHVRTRRPLLVHCAAGIERSPLTIAWWLWRTGRESSLDRAYDRVLRARPEALRRDFWLPRTMRIPSPEYP